MAVINHTGTWLSKGVHKASWTGLLNGDSGDFVEASYLSDKSIQVQGTFGVGGTLIFEGSNDSGVTAFTLNDPQGNPLSFTTGKIEQVLENTQMVRPRVTAGDGATSLTVLMVSRGNLR